MLYEVITDAVKKPIFVDNHDIRVSCAIGVSEYPDAGPHAEALVRGAEFAVRTAKTRGRDTTLAYDESLSASLVYRQRLETALVITSYSIHYTKLYENSPNTAARWRRA